MNVISMDGALHSFYIIHQKKKPIAKVSPKQLGHFLAQFILWDILFLQLKERFSYFITATTLWCFFLVLIVKVML